MIEYQKTKGKIKMKDIRIEKLAHNLLTYSIDLKENDNILIEVLGEDGIPLAKELMRQAEQMKAKPYFNIVNYELLRIMLENATEEQIKLYGKHDKSGEWKEVRCRQSEVPAQIVPEAIRNYVKTNYPDARILQIEYDDNEYEIKLSNRWEITFDSKMRVIDIDD